MYIFCEIFPLRVFLIFMTMVDILLVLLDGINLSSRVLKYK